METESRVPISHGLELNLRINSIKSHEADQRMPASTLMVAREGGADSARVLRSNKNS
jgi:hypothetical protein